LLADLAQGRFSVVDFYERRARRILPALFAVLGVTSVLVAVLLLPSDAKEYYASLLAVTGFISNIFFWHTSGYFDTSADLKPLLHTWSLSVEEQFYLLYPLLLAALWRFGRTWMACVLSTLALCSLAAAHWAVTHQAASIAFFLLPTRAWELLLGGLAAVLPWQAKGRPAAIAALTGAAMIGYAVSFFDPDTAVPGLPALVPAVGATLVLVAAQPGNATGRLLGTPWMVGLGLISYSAYLWHQPLLALARQLQPEPDLALRGALILTTLLLAWASWRWIEQPFRARGQFSRSRIFVLSGLGTLGFVALAAVGVLSSGFAGRYPDQQDRELATLEMRTAGAYVARRFDALQGQNFSTQDPRRKILLIGDSFAKDLLNAMAESPMDRRFQFSTRHIVHMCGNLFMPRAEFEVHLRSAPPGLCASNALFEDAALRARMQEADEIWFASAWQPWQAPLVADSLRRTKEFAGKPVKVFNRKNFGTYRIREILAVPATQRLTLTRPVLNEVLVANELLQRSVPKNQLVDVQGMLCGADPTQCRLMTPGGALISHDGGHLTVHGAKWLGQRMSAEETFR